MSPEPTIKSPIRHTHQERGKVEAWHYSGQPKEQWPDWVTSHYRHVDHKPRKGRWAIRDDEGYFWRWLGPDKFTAIYEPLP